MTACGGDDFGSDEGRATRDRARATVIAQRQPRLCVPAPPGNPRRGSPPHLDRVALQGELRGNARLRRQLGVCDEDHGAIVGHGTEEITE